MSAVQVVGAGFSGLATAYYLTRRGISVEIFERSDRTGGLISTERTRHGLVETAAHGILNSALVEELFRELGVPMLFPRAASKARYLFRGGPRRWPLSVSESLALVGRLASRVLFRAPQFRPHLGETVILWGNRVLGPAATEFVLAPALQGIYAGRPAALSASLILGRRSRPPGRAKPRRRGLVAPPQGMGELIGALTAYLERRGVRIHLKTAAPSPAPDEWRVLCTSARDASRLLEELAPQASQKLSRVEMLPLVTATAFYPAGENRPGFGILFPRSEGFRALGVLFDANIFEGRAIDHSETWILGGAEDRAVLDLTDDQLFDLIDADRRRLCGRDRSPLARHLTRWPEALPHYTVELEVVLEEPLALPPRTFLVGNYLGGLGLAKILQRADQAARDLATEYRSVH